MRSPPSASVVTALINSFSVAIVGYPPREHPPAINVDDDAMVL
ncbi:hypothetical protein I550_3940 [Mycobacterium intracellulare 1956]|uniref:Uncharacterized protein n=1 Tax=Mycobacterium intracellulare 1956 TaxID=1299331 RepID=X8CK47_MYCIT|nr:hypothetical protein I548_0395 [Mycobacterium intracellulare]EUA55783.1 hypothetical protein I550_3940 [Mycobacterium intracellulare 1956]